MPPKKGGGKNDLWDIIMFPFRTAGNVVFYPVQFTMWLIVDFIGKEHVMQKQEGQKLATDKRARFPRLMKIQRVKDTVKFVKEFRTVLYENFGWKRVKSSGGGWKCKNCSQPAQWYCVDCNKKFCAQCTYNLHAPGTNNEKHSIEELVLETKAHCHFITPLLPQLMLAGLVFYCCRKVTFVTKEYTTSQITCPMVTQARNAIGSIDSNILYHYKQYLLSCCDMEDSYVRFIVDAWVRTIVLDTDNTALVFQTLPQAFLFNLALEYSIVPALAVVYAVVLNLAYQIECRIEPNDTLKWLEKVAKSLNFSSFVFGEKVFDLAETKERRRDPLDVMDWLRYKYARKVRDLKYYYHYCAIGLGELAKEVLWYTMFFRLACIWFKLSAPIRTIFTFMPFSSLQAHQNWFAHTKHTFVTEALLWQILMKVVNTFTGFISIPFFRYYLLIWAVLVVLVALAGSWVAVKMVKQRRKFDADWKKKKEGCLDFKQKQMLLDRTPVATHSSTLSSASQAKAAETNGVTVK